MLPVVRSRIAWGLIVLAAVVLISLIGFYGVRVNSRTPATLLVSGTIEATQVEVSAKYAGRIVALLAREGARVAPGQLLVRLDDQELRAEVQRNEAAVRSAEAQLRDLLAGARKEEIEEARQSLKSASATREWTERDFRRAEELFKRELIAAQDVDRARQAYEVAQAQERAARERLDLLLAGPRPHQVEAARAQLSQAEAALAQVRSRFKETEIISPISGVVLRKNLEAGETANPGVSILTLVDPQDLWLRAYVPETEIGRVKVGQPARITIDAFKDRAFTGRITEIASEAEFTPKNVQTQKERANLVFRIKIGVDNPEGSLKPGMPADAEIAL